MKKYEIFVVGYENFPHIVIADLFDATTNDNTTKGYYAFYKDNKLIACYPIDRTVIKSITNIENGESNSR